MQMALFVWQKDFFHHMNVIFHVTEILQLYGILHIVIPTDILNLFE